ncbi:MAG: thioredoxin family protein [Elusimicrobiota bacterium]
MRLALTALILVFTACTLGPQGPYDSKRDPEPDYRSALAEGQRGNRRILVIVGRNSCSWTKKLDALFAEDREIAARLAQAYVLLRVHFDNNNTNARFLSRFPPVAGVPHLFVLDKDGRLLCSQETDPLEAGDAHDRTKVLDFLTKWAF